jgi:hypothetical protein
MGMLRSMGYLFFFLVVPLGALLASNPEGIAQWLSNLLGMEVTRGNLGVAFIVLTGVCLKIDLTRRRRAQQREAAAV